jgi:hypothetical protein
MELLIMAVSHRDKNTSLDRMSYKQGDVVVIMPDKHMWGTKEGLPTFWRVKVRDAQPEDYSYLMDMQMDMIVPEESQPFTRRQYKFNHHKLPAELKRQLEISGKLTLPIEAFKEVIGRVSDGN